MNRQSFYRLAVERGLDPLNAYEVIIREIYKNILSPGDMAIDGGAHLGLHTFPMARAVGESGRVLAFEAIPSICSKLTKAVIAHGYDWVHNYSFALGEASGPCTFYVYEDAPGYSGLHSREALLSQFELKKPKSIVAEMVQIDDFVSSGSELRFIKLDLEGGEFGALLGATKVLKDEKPVVIFEHTLGNISETNLNEAELYKLFFSLGYRVVDLLGQIAVDSSIERNDMLPYLVAFPESHNSTLDIIESVKRSVLGIG